MKPPKFDAKRIIWQPDPARPWEWDGFVYDPIQSETVHCAHVFTELGCAGYWYMWDDYPGSMAKDHKYHGRCADSTKLGFVGTIKLVEDKWKELNK